MILDATLDITVERTGVTFAFGITNPGTEPIDLTFRTGMVADVAVYQDGVEVWRWSDGRMFTQAIETQTLAPGETLVFEANWDDSSPGSYTAEASLAATNVTLVEREPFEVP